MTIAGLFNSAWMWQCRPEAIRYEHAANNVEQTQANVLRAILNDNATSDYGRTHRFSNIRGVRQFHQQVPVCNYESLIRSIDRIADGQTGVLTSEPVLLFEPTSGTSGAEKLIPYTRTLKRQFQRAISAWAWDTLSNRPHLRRGSSYWSLSPAFGKHRITSGGLSVGFDDDTHYLSLPQRLASSCTFAVTPSVARLANIDNFRYSTLLQLLWTSNLTMISVWSPTFLTALLDKLDEWWPTICHDISRGGVTWPAPHDLDSKTKVLAFTSRRPNPTRADFLKAVFRSSADISEQLSMIWPALGLISCWTDASAARYILELEHIFPNVEIQSKGLISTEGVISIPRTAQTGTALALRSHYFEFQEERSAKENAESTGPIRLAHELESGGTYRVVITTGGGLYRYQLGDLIRVRGFWRQCPLIEFLGRSTVSSDLVGEKLHEQHVREVLQQAFSATAIVPSFSMLVPAIEKPPGYVLYVQGPAIDSTLTLCQDLSQRLQAGLEQNPHYRHAVQLGQLAKAKTIVLDPNGESAWQIFERGCIANGQVLGDIKPVALHPGTQWTTAFASEERDRTG